MVIKIKAFSFLRNYLQPSDNRLDDDEWVVPDDATVGQVLEMLNLGGRGDLLLLVNGNHAQSEIVLSEGDALSILPPIGGG
jgi:molybdopterin converting factor small subunit